MQKRHGLLIIIMLAALVLAACGGNNSGSTTGDTTPAADAPTDSPTADSGDEAPATEDSTSGIGGTGDDASGNTTVGGGSEGATPTPEGGSAASAGDEIPDVDGFAITLTGFIEATLTTGGFYQCNSQVGIVQIGTTTGQSEQVTISFPLDTEAGAYALVGAGEGTPGEDVTIALTSARVNLYGLGEGTLALSAVGTAPGEQMAGIFTFTLGDGHNTIDGTGAFNFTIAEGSPLCVG